MRETSFDRVEKLDSIRCLILKAPKGKTAEMPVFLVKLKRKSRERNGMETGSSERDVHRAAGTFTRWWTTTYSPERSKPVNMGV